ncbi:MAG: arginase family protein [Theionarchaea archaeon]|nr:arginase family protein [Theionarchaea archaeon]MBU7038545.1 arginase family protein [Theionarchaea archaeon]
MNNRYIVTPYFLDEDLPQLEELLQPGWLLNKPCPGEGDTMTRMSVVAESLAGCVVDALAKGERPVSIAGDCCTTLGVLAGLQRTNITPVLIWFDAHGDFNTWETTPSGFLGGMPLAMIAGRGDQKLVEAVGFRNLPEEKVVLVGARDLDPGEKAAVEGSAIHFVSDPKSLPDYPVPDGPLYVHFDTDVVDPRDAPAMSYRAEGGLSAGELREVFRYLSETGRIVAVSLSSWNPRMEGADQSRRTCMDLLKTLVE